MTAKRTSKKEPAKRPYHHGDLREALLAATRAELHEVGFRDLSLRSVARRAGVTHTAAYHHFDDKNALLCAIAVEGFLLLDQRMAEAMDAAGTDPVDRLIASGFGYLKMAAEDAAAYDLMFNGVAFEKSKELLEVAPRSFQRLLAAVQAAREHVGHTEGDVLNDALLHWEVVHGTAMLARVGMFALRGVDVEKHFRYVGDRLRALYTKPR